jgi:hypothetical protein
MNIHTTNYFNTFIEASEDCPAKRSEIPPIKGDEKSAANIQFEMIGHNPYKFTSDEILFQCFATKKNVADSEMNAEKEQFFSKGQPCLRCSPLAKRYGWGIHFNEEGKTAIYAVESEEYKKFITDSKLIKVKAMRNKKKIQEH